MQLSHTIKMLVKEIEIICKNLKFEERKVGGEVVKGKLDSLPQISPLE